MGLRRRGQGKQPIVSAPSCPRLTSALAGEREEARMSRLKQHLSGAPTPLHDRLVPTWEHLPRNDGTGPDARRPSVLVVDDDAAIRTLLTEALERAGFSVTALPDGFSALNYVRRAQPDVVVLDLGLPVLDGQEFLDAWTTVTPVRVVPILVLSATTELPPLLSRLGIEEHITKPFDIDLVVAAVSRLAARSRA
jgi:CheY-like chemotaxis protein